MTKYFLILLSFLLLSAKENTPVEKEIKRVPAENRASAELSIADCSSDVTVTDYLILEEIATDLKALKKRALKETSLEYKKIYEAILEGADEGLTPAAKGMLATHLFKESLQADGQSKEFRLALFEFQEWGEFHMMNFGPGTPYASFGVLDMINTPMKWLMDQIYNGGEKTPLVSEIYEKSIIRVGDKAIKLLNVIRLLDIPQETKSAMSKKISEYNHLLSQRDQMTLDATIQRAEAIKSSVIQVGAAVEAELLSLVLSKIGASNGPGKFLISGINKTKSTITKKQIKMLLKALQSGGDASCAWGIMASKENPRIWREAIEAGVKKGAFTLATQVIKGASDADINLLVDTFNITKNTEGYVKGAFGTGQDSILAAKKFKESGILISQARAEKNLKKRGKIEKDAREKLREAKAHAIDAGADMIDLAFDTVETAKNLDQLGRAYDKIFRKVF
jgi:hypothetical protein